MAAVARPARDDDAFESRFAQQPSAEPLERARVHRTQSVQEHFLPNAVIRIIFQRGPCLRWVSLAFLIPLRRCLPNIPRDRLRVNLVCTASPLCERPHSTPGVVDQALLLQVSLGPADTIVHFAFRPIQVREVRNIRSQIHGLDHCLKQFSVGCASAKLSKAMEDRVHEVIDRRDRGAGITSCQDHPPVCLPDPRK